jgi:ribosomal-protein-alanine N-acetyltransferase
MAATDLDGVLYTEQRAYSFPWSRGNFIDSLAAGHAAWVLVSAAGAATAPAAPDNLAAYYVAMAGFEELHLLNITVAPDLQGQGLARHLLAHLDACACASHCPSLWLEVRESNARARQLYQRWGYAAVGRRKGYYPAGHGQREDAIVMGRTLPQPAALGGPNALV